MKKILRSIRLSAFLLLTAVQVSCNKLDPHSDNAFRKMLASLDWGNDVCLVYGPSLRDGVCYSETRLGRKVDVIPTLTEILGR